MKSFLIFILITFSLILFSKGEKLENKTFNKTNNNQINITENKIENKIANKSENKTSNKSENITTNKSENKTSNKSENITFNKSENKTSNKSENKASNNTKNKEKSPKKKPKKNVHQSPLRGNSSIPEDFNVTNNNVYSLNDITIDMVLQKGNNYRWLVILYSETCGLCKEARREIRKILPKYRNSSSIRFAEIEINYNRMTNMRFEIDGVPYIFLLQNNTMYEMDTYASQKNLIKFIETDFKNISQDELKPFPPMVPIYKFGWEMAKIIFGGITNLVNDILYDKGYEFEFTPFTLFFSIVLFFGSTCFIEFFICSRICPDDNGKKRKVRKKIFRKKDNEIEEKEGEEEKEKEGEEGKVQKGDESENNEVEDDKNINKEEKSKREKEEEKEKEEKKKKEKEKKKENKKEKEMNLEKKDNKKRKKE